MRPAAVAFLVALAAGGGCGEQGGRGVKGDRPADVPELGAAEFYRDYSSRKGAARLKKYKDGVLVSGTVEQTVDLGREEGIQLWLAVEGPGHIAARFQDGGARIGELKVQPGSRVTLLCQLGGKPDDVLFLVDCVVR